MKTITYIPHLDVLWIAVDKNGIVGAFITAGEGPIPFTASESIEDQEPALNELPFSSDVEWCEKVPRPDDFVFLASRGVTVFD